MEVWRCGDVEIRRCGGVVRNEASHFIVGWSELKGWGLSSGRVTGCRVTHQASYEIVGCEVEAQGLRLDRDGLPQGRLADALG